MHMDEILLILAFGNVEREIETVGISRGRFGEC